MGIVVGELFATPAAAGEYVTVPFTVEDQPGDVAGQEYAVTVIETSATAAGTVTYGFVGGTIS